LHPYKNILTAKNAKEDTRGRQEVTPSKHEKNFAALAKSFASFAVDFLVGDLLSVLFLKFLHEGYERLHAATWKGVIN
jgi:hypothetical protein